MTAPAHAPSPSARLLVFESYQWSKWKIAKDVCRSFKLESFFFFFNDDDPTQATDLHANICRLLPFFDDKSYPVYLVHKALVLWMKQVVQFPRGKKLNKSTSEYVLVNMRSEIIIIEKLIGILINVFWSETLEVTMLIGQKQFWILHLWKTSHNPCKLTLRSERKQLHDETKGYKHVHRESSNPKNIDWLSIKLFIFRF